MNRPIAAAALLLTVASAQLPADNLALPDLGDPTGGSLSVQEEARLGQAFMRQLRAAHMVDDDPVLNGYLQRLGDQLTAHSDRAGGTFTFFLVNDPEVNAFAGPAGYIGIHAGLILATESEAELASVMAHEIAHVTQNHLRRAFDDAGRLSVPSAALLLAGILLGAAANNPQVGLAAVAGVQAGVMQHQINFTRDNEKEADRIGMQILADSSIDPTAMPVFFGRLGAVNRLYDNGKIPEFLRTHPITESRIADTRARAESYPYRQTPDSLEYHLARAALEVKSYRTAAAAVSAFRTTLKEGRYRNEEAQRYGFALALLEARQFAEAEPELNALLRGRPLQVEYLLAQASLFQETGRSAKALTTLGDGLAVLPGSFPLLLRYAEQLIVQGQPVEAQRRLEAELKYHDEDVRLYELLGKAAGDAGRLGDGYLYLAEARYLGGDIEGAVQQLEGALRNRALPYFDEARISARLKTLREERDEMRRERGGDQSRKG